MPTIKKIEIEDILARLPELEPFDDAPTKANVGVFIGGYGFEDRATAIPLSVDPSKVESCIFLKYACNESDNAPSRDAIRNHIGEDCITEIEFDRSTIDVDLASALINCTFVAKSVCVDISALASYAIYPVLDTILEHCGQCSLTVVYSEAEEYFPSQQEWQGVWSRVDSTSDTLEKQQQVSEYGMQSSGVGSIYASKQHPGHNEGPLPVRIVAIPNFGLERIKSMIAVAGEELDTATVSWIVGKPPNHTRNGWRMDAISDLYGIRDGATLVSTRTYSEMLRALEDLYIQILGKEHMMIATVGSKMQHVATSLFLHLRTSVGLVLCEPESYNSARFSTGTGQRWKLEFGSIDTLKSHLGRLGTIDFSW